MVRVVAAGVGEELGGSRTSFGGCYVSFLA